MKTVQSHDVQSNLLHTVKELCRIWSTDVEMVELYLLVASGPPPRGNIKNIRAAWERAACHNSRITKIILSRSYKIIYTSATP